MSAIPIFSYFLTLKKYDAKKYKILSFNCIMKIYSNVYDYAINLKLSVFFACFKHTVKIHNHNFARLLKISINNHTLLYIHINNHSLLYIHINTHNNYHKKYT